jgi:hypothetical protein
MTIGFEDSTGNSDSHWHLGREEEVDPSDLLEKTSKFLDDILTDKMFIVHKETTGYHLRRNIEEVSQKKSNPKIGIYKWSDL